MLNFCYILNTLDLGIKERRRDAVEGTLIYESRLYREIQLIVRWRETIETYNYL